MTSEVQTGPAIVAGYKWSLQIKADTAAFPEGIAIEGHVRRKVGDVDPPLATLSTGSAGGVERVDDTTLEITIDGASSKDWTAGTVVMDFVRTDSDPDEYLGFILTVPVVLPVTRGLV